MANCHDLLSPFYSSNYCVNQRAAEAEGLHTLFTSTSSMYAANVVILIALYFMIEAPLLTMHVTWNSGQGYLRILGIYLIVFTLLSMLAKCFISNEKVSYWLVAAPSIPIYVVMGIALIITIAIASNGRLY